MTEYERVYRELNSRILSGEWPPNAKLPVERALCTQLGVSRITVRQALHLLELEGRVLRVQGSGTFVLPPKIEQPLSAVYSFTEELRKQSIVPGVRILSFRCVPSELGLKHRLGLAEGTAVYELRRLRLANQVPFVYETSYIEEPLLHGARSEDIEADGLYATLRRLSGTVVDHAAESFEAVLADRGIVAALERESPLSVMRLERIAYAGERPVEYCESYVCGDRYRFHITLR